MAEYRIVNEDEHIAYAELTGDPISGLHWEISRLDIQASADDNLNWKLKSPWSHDRNTELTNTSWHLEEWENLIEQVRDLQKRIEKDDNVTWEPYDQRSYITFPSNDKIAVLPQEVLDKIIKIRDELSREIKSDLLRENFGELDIARPLLKKAINGEDNPLRIEPAIVEKMEITSTGNSERHVDLCGNVKNEKISENEWKAVIEGIISHEQFEKLKEMKPADGTVEIISDMHNADVEFDRFTVTQTSELNKGWFSFIEEQDTPFGSEKKSPLYQFQLQTRDEEN